MFQAGFLIFIGIFYFQCKHAGINYNTSWCVYRMWIFVIKGILPHSWLKFLHHRSNNIWALSLSPLTRKSPATTCFLLASVWSAALCTCFTWSRKGMPVTGHLCRNSIKMKWMNAEVCSSERWIHFQKNGPPVHWQAPQKVWRLAGNPLDLSHGSIHWMITVPQQGLLLSTQTMHYYKGIYKGNPLKVP